MSSTNIRLQTAEGSNVDCRAIDPWKRNFDLQHLSLPWDDPPRVSYEIWDVSTGQWVLAPATHSATITWTIHTLLMPQPDIREIPWFDLELQALAFAYTL